MKTASQLPAASTLTGSENIWADQGSTTVRVTPEQIKTYAAAGLAAGVGTGYRFADGSLQLKNQATGKWHAVTVSGTDGKVALAVSASGQN